MLAYKCTNANAPYVCLFFLYVIKFIDWLFFFTHYQSEAENRYTNTHSNNERLMSIHNTKNMNIIFFSRKKECKNKYEKLWIEY